MKAVAQNEEIMSKCVIENYVHSVGLIDATDLKSISLRKC